MPKRAYMQFGGNKATPQSRPIPGSAQVPNSAGGFAWKVDKWKRLERFLILGAEGGTYYIGESQLVEENCHALVECVAEDGLAVLATILDIRRDNRNIKQDPLLFALAYTMASGDVETRRQAANLLPQIARTGRQLFTFCSYALQFRSWGNVLRRAVANWYLTKSEDDLAYQVVKYRQGGGFTHKRLLNVSHPDPTGTGLENVLRWAHGDEVTGNEFDLGLPRMIEGFELAKKAATAKQVAELVRAYGLTWEMLPTEHLNDPRVLEALLEKMPVMATIRQLPRLTAHGVLSPRDWDGIELVVDRLHHVHEAGVHPMQILVALRGYASGKSPNLEWTPVEQILTALDTAFYRAFGNVEPTGKTIVLGMDVSASMDDPLFTCRHKPTPGAKWLKDNHLTPREAAACMAMVSARVEHRIVTIAFDTDTVQFRIQPNARLEHVVQELRHMRGGGTDCAVPMLEATRQGVSVDAFIIYTDSETWAGQYMHPSQALQDHRNKMQNKAKLIVVGMTSNGFSIADPNDRGMLDVVGFDTSVPQVMSDFIS